MRNEIPSRGPSKGDPQVGSSWPRMLAIFTLATLFEAIYWGQVAAFTPLYLPRLGIAPAEVVRWTGISVALAALIGIPFIPLWGALADRYARRPIIIRSFVAHIVAAIVMILAKDIWTFVLGRALMSFSYGNTGLMMTTLSERAPKGRLGVVLSVMNSAAPAGAFLGPVLGGWIVDHWGFRLLLGLDSVGLVAIILALTFGYRDAYQGTDRGSLVQMAVGSVGLIWKSASIRMVFFGLFLLDMAWAAAFVYVPLAVTTLYRGTQPGTAVGVVLGARRPCDAHSKPHHGPASRSGGPLAGVADRYRRGDPPVASPGGGAYRAHFWYRLGGGQWYRL